MIGDVRVTPVAVPGHTAGAMGFIFRGQRRRSDAHSGTLRRHVADPQPAERRRDADVPCGRSLISEKRPTAPRWTVWLQNHPLMVPFRIG